MDESPDRRGMVLLITTILVALGTMGLAAGWTGPVNTNVIVESLTIWGTQGSLALLWLGMAAGFGAWLAPALGIRGRRDGETLVIIAGLGIAAALVVDLFCGWLGILLIGRGMATWAITVAGLLLLVLRVRQGGMPRLRLHAAPSILGAALPLGVLLLAATSAPGWLWRSEFGGYDALSYHLQLPKEWIAAGGVTTFQHNVYSAFPSAVEAAFMHLFLLAGGDERGAIAAQCLASLVTLLTAAGVGVLARRVSGSPGAWLAATPYLATPWNLVVGTLAYNDGFVNLFLAVGLLLVTREPRTAWQSGGALGLLLGAACGAKLTAVGFAVAPLVAVLALRRRGAAIAPLAIAGAVALVTLLPWLVRNALATGNPTFPFLTGLFGFGWWTPEQAAIFRDAHSAAGGAEGGVVGGISRLWSQWLAFGIGEAPSPAEPWAMQWSVLPAVGLAGVAFIAYRWRHRRARVWPAVLATTLAVQAFFWVMSTHQQSRFLIPTAVPLAVAAAAIVARTPRRATRGAVTLATTGAGIVAGLLPLWIFAQEGMIPMMDAGVRVDQHAPALFIGAASICSGDGAALAIRAAPDDNARNAAQQQAPLSFFMNHLLPPADRILLVGDAKPFWYRRTSDTMTYATVWDRGPLSEVAAANPEHPEQWAATLAARGYTWLVLDWAMISNWGEKQWLDPTLTKERMQAFATSMPIVKQFPGGVELRALKMPKPSPG